MPHQIFEMTPLVLSVGETVVIERCPTLMKYMEQKFDRFTLQPSKTSEVAFTAECPESSQSPILKTAIVPGEMIYLRPPLLSIHNARWIDGRFHGEFCTLVGNRVTKTMDSRFTTTTPHEATV